MYFEPMSSKTIENIDVVLVDWHMPTIEGPKVIELIRQQASSIPIFLYTASNNSAEGRKLAEIAGANGYIDKNLTKEKLETAFREKGII
jgi:CheY-like chemotaxis protein